jgi:cellulose synthase operon protein C
MVLATMLLHAGDFARARREHEALLPRYSDDPVFVNNLAWLYFDANDPRAEDLARKAHAAMPDNPDIADTLGWILANSDKRSAREAVELLEKAVAEHETPSALYHLAVAQQKAGRAREARETVARSLAVGQFPERAKAVELAKSFERS